MIKKYNIDKYKKATLKLLVGVTIGVTALTGCSNNYDEELESAIEEEVPVYKLPLQEKLKTRGALTIYFQNNEYIDEVNPYLKYKADCLTFYNEKGSCYGVIVSKEIPYTTTFEPGNYKFYSQYLDIEGEFTITNPGEYQYLEIDYKNRTYNISNDCITKNK